VILQRKVSHTNMEVDVTITIEGAQPHENVIALIKHLPKSDAVDATVYLERHHGDPRSTHLVPTLAGKTLLCSAIKLSAKASRQRTRRKNLTSHEIIQTQ